MKQDFPDFTPGAATDEPASFPNFRTRHDGFGEERKLLFLTALRQGASVLHACALVGISNRTAYNHRRRDPGFAKAWRLSRGAHTLPLELVAFQRAVEGVEEQVYRHGKHPHQPPPSRGRLSPPLHRTNIRQARRTGLQAPP